MDVLGNRVETDRNSLFLTHHLRCCRKNSRRRFIQVGKAPLLDRRSKAPIAVVCEVTSDREPRCGSKVGCVSRVGGMIYWLTIHQPNRVCGPEGLSVPGIYKRHEEARVAKLNGVPLARFSRSLNFRPPDRKSDCRSKSMMRVFCERFFPACICHRFRWDIKTMDHGSAAQMYTSSAYA